MKKGTKLYSVLTSTCPHCQEHKMFKSHAYDIKKMDQMHKNCPNCGNTLEPEPSFYTGAMYVSYAFSCAIVIGVFVGSNILFKDPNVNVMVVIGIGSAVLLAPLNFRLSRMIWANAFMSYKGKTTKDISNLKESI